MFGVFLFAGVEARATVELTLVRTNITMPSGQQFQMPLNGFDSNGSPLKFSIVSIKSGRVTGTIATNTNRSLLLNVSGVDATNGPFTGDMTLQLFEDLTPLTTARIIDLVNSNFYNGLTFHRVVAGFVAQGGDPNGNGTGGSGVTFDDEFVTNLTYDGFGQLGMANTGPDSNDSQFFITDPSLSLADPTNKPPEHLNFMNTIFGQMTSGFDVLAKIMQTPVIASNDMPVTHVVMNNVSVFSDTSNAVLRLTAAKGFKGSAVVTLKVVNTNNESATQTLHVDVIQEINNDSTPFLGPIPSAVVVTQFQEVTFIVNTFDINGVRPFFELLDANTGSFPTNMSAIVVPKTQRLWIDPDMTLTGTVDLIIGVTDELHTNAQQTDYYYDTQHFSMTVVPQSPTPTMTIVPRKGYMFDTPLILGDRVNISGTFAFTNGSDHVFSSNDIVVLSLGNPTTPLTATLTPDLAGFKLRKGVLTAKGKVNSGFSTNVNVSALFDSVKSNFTISASHFDFPGTLETQILVGVAIGNDYGSNVTTWTADSLGRRFTPPAAP